MPIYKSLVRKVSIPAQNKIKQKDYLHKGAYPVIDQGHELIGGYTDDPSKLVRCRLPVIVFGDHTKAVKYITFSFAAGADGIKVLEVAEGIDPRFLFYATKYLTYKIENKGYARHYQFVEKKGVSIPELPEQQRIVARIEELFSQIDDAEATLQKAKAQLAVYRQVAISSAFPSLPEDEWVRLDCIAEIAGGITKGRDLSGQRTIELPYLRVANVQNGYLDLSVMKTIELKESEKVRYLLKEGDVLYTEGGDRDKLGRGTVWRGEIPECVHQNHIFKARLQRDKALPEYVAYWSMSTFARNYFYEKGKQSVNLASINKTVLSALKLPIPSMGEQKNVVSEIDMRLSVCNSIEQTINQLLLQVMATRQSILSSVFRGE